MKKIENDPSKKEMEERGYRSSFFTIARFGPDSLLIYAFLIGAVAVLYTTGFRYLAILPAVTLGMIFAIESSEKIRLDTSCENQLVGSKCKVIKQISRSERGVVEILDSSGNWRWELWSAESNSIIEEGDFAKVARIKGIFLEVEPLSEQSRQ